jgi:hypothetical protein
MPIDFLFQDLPDNTVPIDFLFGDESGLVLLDLTSVSLTADVGSVTTSAATIVALNGVQSTVNLGDLAAAVGGNAALTGLAITTGIGTVTSSVAVSVAITGNSSSITNGTVDNSSTSIRAITSVALTSSVNGVSISVSASSSLSGNTASGLISSLDYIVGNIVAISGNTASGLVNNIVNSSTVTFAINGNSSSGNINSVGAIAGVFIDISGAQTALGLGSVGTTASSTIALTQVTATGGVGVVVNPDKIASLSGVSSNASSGFVYIIEGGALTGFKVSSFVGSVCALKDFENVLSSVESVGEVGTVTKQISPVVPLTFRSDAWAPSPALPTLKSTDLTYLEIDANFKAIQDAIGERAPDPIPSGNGGRKIVHVYDELVFPTHPPADYTDQPSAWTTDDNMSKYVLYQGAVSAYGAVLRPSWAKNTIVNFNLNYNPDYGSGGPISGSQPLAILIPADYLYNFPIGSNIIVMLNGNNLPPGGIKILAMGFSDNVPKIHCYPLPSNTTFITNPFSWGRWVAMRHYTDVMIDPFSNPNTDARGCAAMLVKTGANRWHVFGEAATLDTN